MKTILEAFFMAFALTMMLVVALTIACIAVVVPVWAFINGGFVAAFFSLVGIFL